jgi:POT family proton-dependent oligopeptide transporter
MFLVPWLKTMNWSYVILASAICTGAMLLPTIFIYKEPVKDLSIEKERLGKVIEVIFNKIVVVLKDWRFILFIFIYSWFWIMYFQMFDSVLWYVEAFVDASPLNNFVFKLTGINWHFDVEHVTVINALTIILLQLLVSSIVKKTKALPTMITGIAFATAGMAILAINSNIWIFIFGVFIFSIGEMTAHPKFLSYLGMIAPPDKKATYLGFGFLYGVFGSFTGGIVGAYLYVRLVDNPMIAFIRTKLSETGSGFKLPANVNISEAIKTGESIGLTKTEISMFAHPSELWLLFC